MTKLGFAIVFLAAMSGCGSAPRSSCAEGSARSCSCANGVDATQLCAGGQFGACACAAAAPSCGDHICNGDETCTSCAGDCGPCQACSAAPSCTDAVGVPAMPTHRYDLDVNAASMPDLAGAPPPLTANDCGDAQIRLRIANVTVSKGGGQIYCIVSASDGVRSEVALTTKSKDLGDNQTHYFDPSVAMFWGGKTLASTTDNLTITYDCFKVGSDAWAKALQALSDASQKAGQAGGPYGWAFGIGAAAAAAAAQGAAAASGDDHRFNAQQTLDKKTLLDLTNGRTWQVRESGSCGVFCSWDWTITVESWGCADWHAQTG